MMAKAEKKALHEVFSTEYGSVMQNDRKGCFVLTFEGVETELNVPCFFCLKKKLDDIDLEQIINNIHEYPDTEIINPLGCSRCFVLNVSQLYHFKELLSGAKVMLDLNSIIHERLSKSLVQ